MVRFNQLLDEHNKVLIFSADHVGSFQFQQIRIALRGKAIVLMGKNTLMRKILTDYVAAHPGSQFEQLIAHCRGNCCFIFTNSELGDIRDVVNEQRVPAAAKAGVVAECNVVVPPGPTGCDPGQTAWFQALNVPTKISRGQIEIVSELKLVSVGEKVGSSEAALCQKLGLRPFTYGLKLLNVYDDGSIFSAAVLDITDDILKSKFLNAVRRVAAVSIATGIPTLASLPHSIGNAVRRALAIAAETTYRFPACEPWPFKEAAPAAAEAEAAE